MKMEATWVRTCFVYGCGLFKLRVNTRTAKTWAAFAHQLDGDAIRAGGATSTLELGK